MPRRIAVTHIPTSLTGDTTAFFVKGTLIRGLYKPIHGKQWNWNFLGRNPRYNHHTGTTNNDHLLYYYHISCFRIPAPALPWPWWGSFLAGRTWDVKALSVGNLLSSWNRLVGAFKPTWSSQEFASSSSNMTEREEKIAASINARTYIRLKSFSNF